MADARSGTGFNAVPSWSALKKMEHDEKWGSYNKKMAREGSPPCDSGADDVLDPFEQFAKMSAEKTEEDLRLGRGINARPSPAALAEIDHEIKWRDWTALARTKIAGTTYVIARKHLGHNNESLQKRQLEDRASFYARCPHLMSANMRSSSTRPVVAGANDESKTQGGEPGDSTASVGGPNDHIPQGGAGGVDHS
jgi:hypothetical protein